MTPTSVAHDDVMDLGTTDAELGWFVYAVVDADSTLPGDLTGLDDQPVQTVECGRVAAVVSRFRLERPPGRSADLLAFHRVVDGLADAVEAVVPVSFGSVMLDEESHLRGPPGAQRGLVRRARRRRAGTRAAHRAGPLRPGRAAAGGRRRGPRDRPAARADPRPSRGSRTRRAGAARRARGRGRRASSYGSTPRPCSRTSCRSPPPTWCDPVSGLERVLDVAVLVDAAQREELENRLEVLAEEVHGRIRLRLLGPTAPYDFAGEA